MTKEGKDITIDMATQLKLEKKAIEKDLMQKPIDMDMTKALILGLLLGIDKKPDEKDKLREDLVKVFAPEQNKEVLDKIKEEIEQEYNRLNATRTDETLELGECLGLKMALKIINKYKGGGDPDERKTES